VPWHCNPIVSPELIEADSALNEANVSSVLIETVAARAPTSIEATYCARSAHTALSLNEAFAEASFTTRLRLLIPNPAHAL
jgi:hypothetical protein